LPNFPFATALYEKKPDLIIPIFKLALSDSLTVSSLDADS
jgi:hypothetical protein